MSFLKKIFHSEISAYLIFGVLTTMLSYAAFFGFRLLFPGGTVLPNILAWIVSVSFAYITNRKWVFRDSGNLQLGAIKFAGGRLTTLAIDLALMYLLVDLHMPVTRRYEMVVKAIVQVVIIVLNYIISKVFVFRRGRD